MAQPIKPDPVGAPAPEAVPGAGGPPPDKPYHGDNSGIGTGRPTEDDRAGQPRHRDGTGGWNSNT
jgi:hypothetical protein